jgi:hypothetical protein
MVDYLAEVCDPCQDPSNAYIVNDLALSDFCTPDFYGPETGKRYSFLQSINAPRQVLAGGYLNFRDPGSFSWTRAERNGNQLQFIDVGEIGNTFRSLRAAVDYRARLHAAERQRKSKRKTPQAENDPGRLRRVQHAAQTLRERRASLIRNEIEELIRADAVFRSSTRAPEKRRKRLG